MGSIPWLGRSPEKGSGSPLQYSCLANPMDRGTWEAMYDPWGCKESDTTKATEQVQVDERNRFNIMVSISENSQKSEAFWPLIVWKVETLPSLHP